VMVREDTGGVLAETDGWTRAVRTKAGVTFFGETGSVGGLYSLQ
jgi:hypothetical protein